jgi:hypothetical protein
MVDILPISEHLLLYYKYITKLLKSMELQIWRWRAHLLTVAHIASIGRPHACSLSHWEIEDNIPERTISLAPSFSVPSEVKDDSHPLPTVIAKHLAVGPSSNTSIINFYGAIKAKKGTGRHIQNSALLDILIPVVSPFLSFSCSTYIPHITGATIQNREVS